MSVLQIRIAIVLVAVLLATNIYQCNRKPAQDDEILKLENEKKVLEASKAVDLAKYKVVADQRDSALAALKLKPEVDKEIIHIKHEIIRNNIVLLTDSESVQLLSKNLYRRRVSN